MNLTISGYSTALYSSWYFIEELGILFDCGDGTSAGLLGKSGKVSHVFISHADRDHLTGLLQFNQLNAFRRPTIYFPKDCGSFPALESFCEKFDPHTSQLNWLPIESGSKHIIRNDISVLAVRNNHVICRNDIHKSCSYKIVQSKNKLKPEFLGLSGTQLKEITLEKGKEYLHNEILTDILYYSGDTPCENLDDWKNTEVLIHEATFLGGEEDKNIVTHGNQHSKLADVLKAVSESNIKQLILGHFSSRYDENQILNEINRLCKEFNIEIPIHTVLPGELKRNILNT